jgi:phosphomevalonate kinase
LVFEKNAKFFRRNLSKIAENRDHNIDPRKQTKIRKKCRRRKGFSLVAIVCNAGAIVCNAWRNRSRLALLYVTLVLTGGARLPVS